MPYVLKQSDGTHQAIGTSSGNHVDQPDSTFWITGWAPATQQAVAVGGFYLLQFPPDNHTNPVEVKEKGGPGNGGIRFQFTG